MGISLTGAGPIAVLKIRLQDDVEEYGTRVVTSMTGKSYFPDPSPVLDVVSQDIAALAAAQLVARNRAPGAVADRNVKRVKVVQDLKHLCSYVQGVADVQPTLAEAIAVIESAAMFVKRRNRYAKPELGVRDGGGSGLVTLMATAVAKHATYYWQFSSDGKTWVDVPDTLKAGTTISGLAVGQTYSFRFRALTSKGLTDFSQIVSCVVR